MSEPVRLFDYSPVQGQALKLCQKMQDKIQNGQCHLVDLLDPRPWETPRNLQDVRLVDSVCGDSGWTRSYVGLFQLGEEQIVITSRFDQQNDFHKPGKPFFLYCLLETCWDSALLSLEDLGSVYERNLFDLLLVSKLAVQLQKAWKKGTLRQYRTFEHNDSRVRGPIDVPRHIRENLGQENGRIAYRSRAYSPDNFCNVLFLQAADTAERKCPALLNRLYHRLPAFRAALRTLRQETPGWAGVRRETILRHTAKKIINPIYRDYEPARTAARAILRRFGADPERQSARSSAVTGVFLDINDLWERFLEKTLFREIPPILQWKEAILDKHMNIRPDFWWKKKEVVLDAKHRPDWSKTLDERNRLWSKYYGMDVMDDVYQVLTYMLALDCQKGGVVFPARERNRQKPQCSLVNGRQFWRVPVYIPQAENYASFAKQMKEEVAQMKKEIAACGLLE